MATDESPSPLSNLPVEIVREIFQVSAIHDKSSAVALALVSKVVKQWIEPILYSVITLTTTRRFNAFVATFTRSKLKRDLVNRARGLHLPIDRPEALNFLARCNALEHLAIKASYLSERQSEAINVRPLRLVLFGFISSPHPICSNVTHLSIFSVPLDIPLSPRLFPALTHLMGVYILDNTPSPIFLRNLRKTIRRIPMNTYDSDDDPVYPPLQLMVLNICNAPARPDHDKILEVWKYEDELAMENVLMQPSERLTLAQWEIEASSSGVSDRWTRAECSLKQKKDELIQRQMDREWRQALDAWRTDYTWRSESDESSSADTEPDTIEETPSADLDAHSVISLDDSGVFVELDPNSSANSHSQAGMISRSDPLPASTVRALENLDLDRPSSTGSIVRAMKRSLPMSMISSASVPRISTTS